MFDKDGRSPGSALLYPASGEALFFEGGNVQPARADAGADAWAVGGMFSPTDETFGPRNAVLTALRSGGFVVTYLDTNAYVGSEAPLRGRVYSASGTPLGEEFALGAVYDGSYSSQFRVAALSDGGFVAMFSDRSPPNGVERLWAQRYDELGAPEGAQILITELGTSGRWGATVIGLQSGGFMLFWTAAPESFGPLEYRVQMFGPSGEKIGGEFVAGTHWSFSFGSSDVAAAADGSVLLVWSDQQGMVWGRLIGASGTPSGGAFRIDSAPLSSSSYDISVAALTGGGFAVTWTDGPDLNGGDVRGQVLNSQGSRVGEEFSVHAETAGKQMEGSVTALPDGGFAVAWIDYNQAGENYMGGAGRLQMFDAAGNKVGGPVDLEPGAGREHRRTDLITLDGGALVVAHDDFGDDQGYTPGGSTDIYMQIVSPPGADARSDAVTAVEDAALTGNVLADNGDGIDTSPTGAALVVGEVNGSEAAVGSQIELPSGALLRLNADGTFRYDPNGAFDSLAQYGTGASNSSGSDSFTYRLLGGNTATVTVTVRGVFSGPHYVNGTDGADNLTGTVGVDIFAGGAGDDRYEIGAGDTVNESAGGGVDEVRTTLGSRVDYSQMYILPANVEKLTGTATAGQGVYANALDNVVVMGAGSDLVVLQDGGKDLVSGGGGDDFLYWAGTFDNDDRADGGAGYDTVGMLGNLTLAFDADDLVSIEKLAVYSSGDPAAPASYSLTMHDANVAAGQQMMMVAQSLRAGEVFTFNGAAELDGSFNVRGGWGADRITGGAKADTIWGNLGADTLRGGAGKDVFEYSSVDESKAGSADVIMDFAKGDKIYLVGIDADGNAANGDSKFSWLGDGAFTGQAGQLRVTQYPGHSNTWVVEGDVNGDGAADFLLYFVAPLDFVPERSDFYL